MSGIFGVVSKKKNCIEDLFYGTDYHSHLGTEFGGFAFFLGNNLEREIRKLDKSQFKSKFFDIYKCYKKQKKKINNGIGVISNDAEQPIKVYSKFDEFAIVTDGKISSKKRLVNKLIKEYDISLKETKEGVPNQSEVIGEIIKLGDDIVDGIKKVHEFIDGSISLQVLTKDGIYASSDKFPLTIGKRDDDFAIASETCAFTNLGFRIYEYLKPKDIIFIAKDKVEVKEKGKGTICFFDFTYFSFPQTTINGTSIEIYREKSGGYLAESDDIKTKFVGGTPDSGTTYAIGYANKTIDLAIEKSLQYLDKLEKGNINIKKFRDYLTETLNSIVKFRRPLIKYTDGYGRSYMPKEEVEREAIAPKKLLPIMEMLVITEDILNEIVITEDSIITGNQLKKYIKQLRDIAKNVWNKELRPINIRVSCPPAMFSCPYSHAGKKQYKLAARRAIKVLEGGNIKDVSKYLNPNSEEYKKMTDWIAEDVGVASVKYQTLDNMIKATDLSKEQLCTECWTGIKS